jgi:hypothetical protein
VLVLMYKNWRFWDGVRDGLWRIDIWGFSPPKRGRFCLGFTIKGGLGVDGFVWTNVGNIKGIPANMCHNFHGWCNVVSATIGIQVYR